MLGRSEKLECRSRNLRSRFGHLGGFLRIVRCRSEKLNRVVGRFESWKLTLDNFIFGLQIYYAMATSGLRVEDRLDGGGNWTPWKARIVLLLEECELWEIIEQAVTLPTDPILLSKFKKKNVRAKRIILDSVKDHIISHVVGKDYTY